MNHQIIHAEDHEQKVVSISLMEMTAVLKCAAKLADIEGMHGTAERLRNDADTFQEMGTGTIVRII